MEKYLVQAKKGVKVSSCIVSDEIKRLLYDDLIKVSVNMWDARIDDDGDVTGWVRMEAVELEDDQFELIPGMPVTAIDDDGVRSTVIIDRFICGYLQDTNGNRWERYETLRHFDYFSAWKEYIKERSM